MATADVIQQIKKTSVDYSLAQAEKHELKYHVFTNTLLDGAEVTEQDVQKVNLKTNIPTKVFIHGWNSQIKTNWYNAFRDAYLNKGEHNVIYVDWFIPGSRDYKVSAANVKPVGHFIAEFINSTKIDVKNVHLIGKSLGGHVAAWAGKRMFDLTGKKLGRITALDPAAPKFEHAAVTEANRLCENDADFVDVIHTDIEYYGYEKPLGTVDFYPNGGGTQPGCKTDEDGHNDSHGRSNWYFLESISFTGAKAHKSKSWEDYLKGDYNAEDSVIFGEDVAKSAHGVYYFKTNAEPPYLISS